MRVPVTERNIYEWSVLVHKDNILNSNDRKHHMATRDPKRNLRAMGSVQQRVMPRMERIRMDVEASYPKRSRPDAANLHPTIKSYLDGMCHPNGKREREAGFLPDDGDKHVSGPFITWSGWDSGREDWYLFRITVTPLEPWVQPPRPHYMIKK
jgi:hypothetical protein